MDTALFYARRAQQYQEVPVGALVVDPKGTILSATHNQPCALHDPTAHAEILALRQAGQRLGNYRLNHCILVVTLEPCAMCAAALVHARLAGVVFGAADPQAGAILSCDETLLRPYFNHFVWSMGGIRSQECAALLQEFFAQRREK